MDEDKLGERDLNPYFTESNSDRAGYRGITVIRDNERYQRKVERGPKLECVNRVRESCENANAIPRDDDPLNHS